MCAIILLQMLGKPHIFKKKFKLHCPFTAGANIAPTGGCHDLWGPKQGKERAYCGRACWHAAHRRGYPEIAVLVLFLLGGALPGGDREGVFPYLISILLS